MLRAAIAVFLTCLLTACGAARAPAEVSVDVTRLDGDAWRLVFTTSQPVRALDFGRPVGDFRQDYWTFDAPGAGAAVFVLSREDSREVVRRKDGKAFSTLRVKAADYPGNPVKNYRPVSHFSDGGAILYTGYLQPDIKERKGSVHPRVRFDFTPLPGGRVSVLGRSGATVTGWTHPRGEPAFIYFGAAQAVDTPRIAAVVDPGLPRWIGETLEKRLPEAFERLAAGFGFPLAQKPNLFLLWTPGGNEGQYAFNGDALPWQIEIALSGGAWTRPDREARNLLLRNAIHEAAHLWQHEVGPKTGHVPDWIHEGAAEAISARVMVDMGLWTQADWDKDLAHARKLCASSLVYFPLDAAGARGVHEASYACGQTIAAATEAALPKGETILDFWRIYLKAARADGGYSEATYFAVVDALAPGSGLAGRISSFARIAQGNPRGAVDALFQPGPGQAADLRGGAGVVTAPR